MLGILYTFWGMGFLIFMKKGSFFLPRVMWAKLRGEGLLIMGLSYSFSDSCLISTRAYLYP